VINKTMRSARIERELEKITGRPIHDKKNKPGRPRAVWTGRLVGRPA
jgi:hypothetical protein